MEATHTSEETDTEHPEQTIVVSGIQPSGRLHLGNYFGAIRQHIDLHQQHEAYYFIVNYHALTSVQDADKLRAHTRDVALDYLALGFDPEEAHLFIQSDVPAVTELAWIFYNLVSVGRLERGVAYKDKIEQGLTPNAGLLNYPVLQAADILIYGGSLVPVGADPKQHIELTRDPAHRLHAGSHLHAGVTGLRHLGEHLPAPLGAFVQAAFLKRPRNRSATHFVFCHVDLSQLSGVDVVPWRGNRNRAPDRARNRVPCADLSLSAQNSVS